MARWIPTKEERDLIRTAASKEVGLSIRRLVIEPGIRTANDSLADAQMNIALLTNDPDWNDTDLADMSDWDTFCEGVVLTNDCRAIVDFYIYTRGNDGQLESNITAEYSAGSIRSIMGTSGREFI